jgi:DNA-binding Lrp family transcriptional regulator
MEEKLKEIEDYREKILFALTDMGKMSKYKIQKVTKIPYPTVLRLVSSLKENGYIKMVSKGKRRAEIYDVMPRGISHLIGTEKIGYEEGIRRLLRFSRLVKLFKLETLKETSFNTSIEAPFLPPYFLIVSPEKHAPALHILDYIVLDNLHAWSNKTTKEDLMKIVASEEEYRFVTSRIRKYIEFRKEEIKRLVRFLKEAKQFLKRLESLRASLT